MKYKFAIISFLSLSAIALFFSVGFNFPSENKIKVVPKKNVPNDTTFTLLFGGDMMGHQPMINAAFNDSTKAYEYDRWFQFIAPIVKQCDWACANLEVTLGGEPYTGYPQFSSPDEFPVAIKNAGFDFLVNANNHSQDRGSKGLERTIKVLDSLSIPHTGTFIDTLSFTKNYPAIVEVANCKIAILNYTYGTNGLIVKNPNIVNMIDSAAIIRDIRKARKMGAQLIIPVLHWGVEYQTKENSEQRKIAEYLANEKVNAIIGMHPHVVEPIKYQLTIEGHHTDSIPVAYSLGNYISNQRDRNRDGGIMVRLTVERKNKNIDIIFKINIQLDINNFS